MQRSCLSYKVTVVTHSVLPLNPVRQCGPTAHVPRGCAPGAEARAHGAASASPEVSSGHRDRADPSALPDFRVSPPPPSTGSWEPAEPPTSPAGRGHGRSDPTPVSVFHMYASTPHAACHCNAGYQTQDGAVAAPSDEASIVECPRVLYEWHRGRGHSRPRPRPRHGRPRTSPGPTPPPNTAKARTEWSERKVGQGPPRRGPSEGSAW